MKFWSTLHDDVFILTLFCLHKNVESYHDKRAKCPKAKCTVKLSDCRNYRDSSRPKRNDKDTFQDRITEYICNAPISARFKLWIFTKTSYINIFPSLAILSHLHKTKSAKLTSNIFPSIDQAFPVIIEKWNILFDSTCLSEKERTLHFNIQKMSTKRQMFLQV